MSSIPGPFEKGAGGVPLDRRYARSFPLPTIRVTRSVTWGLTNAADTLCFFDTVVYSQGGCKLINNAIIIPKRGLWRVNGTCQYDASATGLRQTRISTLGVEIDRVNGPSSASGTSQAVSGEYTLNVGDQLGLYVYQASGGALNVIHDYTWMSATYVADIKF